MLLCRIFCIGPLFKKETLSYVSLRQFMDIIVNRQHKQAALRAYHYLLVQRDTSYCFILFSAQSTGHTSIDRYPSHDRARQLSSRFSVGLLKVPSLCTTFCQPPRFFFLFYLSFSRTIILRPPRLQFPLRNFIHHQLPEIRHMTRIKIESLRCTFLS